MKAIRLFLAAAVVAALAGLAYVAQETQTPGLRMTEAAGKFLASLSAEQKERIAFPFDSKERTNWFFIPLQDKNLKSTRKGVPLEDMSAEQKKAALELLQAGTSEQGNVAATTIMSLEAILREQEKKGAMVRNPDWYFFTIFGTPSKTGKWGWRVEGHHLALNFALEGTEVIAATPSFFGANPAEVKGGPKKGLRILASSEDLAKKLWGALDDEQKKVAHQAKHFPEPKQGKATPEVGEPVGLPAGRMTAEQKSILKELLESYTARMPAAVAGEELKQVRKGGFENIHFAFAGSSEAGKGLTYRVQGPTFVIEFLNIQGDSAGNPANHIHSAWRRIKGDFGLE
jgi:hypothetical protein